MNVLTTLLPGLRELRTPLAIGAMWLVAAALVVAPIWPDLLLQNAGLSALQKLLAPLPQAFVLSGLAFLAYVLGAVLAELSDWLIDRVMRVAGGIGRLVRKKVRYRKRTRWVHRLTKAVDVSEVRGPVIDAVGSAFAKTAAPSAIAFAFPIEIVIGRFDATALQLWHKSAAQYQEYDRLRAESAFRRGISVPFLAISIVLGASISWWIVLAAVVCVTALIVQSVQLDHRRAVLIANALYQELVTDPLLEGVVREVPKVKVQKDAEYPAWHAVLVVALDRMGEFAGVDEAMWSVVHGISELADYDESVDDDAFPARVKALLAEVDYVLDEAGPAVADNKRLIHKRLAASLPDVDVETDAETVA